MFIKFFTQKGGAVYIQIMHLRSEFRGLTYFRFD